MIQTLSNPILGSNHRMERSFKQEKGAALVITLLLLSLISVLGLVMFLSTSSDMLINGYYRNYRGAFYAADSGLNIARQQIVNQITAAAPAAGSGWTGNPPIANATTTASNTQAYLTTNYATSTALNAGQAANSWGEKFKIVNPTVTLAAGYPLDSFDANNQRIGTKYIFNYTLSSVGTSQGSEQATVAEDGSVTFNITGNTGQTKINYAAYGGFVDNYPPCQIGYLVPGTMTGPMFTNGSWGFGTGGNYLFTDPVGQHSANASYWFGNTCYQSPTNNYKSGNQTIKPTFQGGLNLGQAAIPLPTNNFNQKWAVLDGLGTTSTDPTNANKNNALRDISGTKYSSSGASSGVFLSYTAGSGSPNVMTGGGIWVEGDASVTLNPSSTSAQVYKITQGSTLTTVTIDPLATPPSGWSCPAGTTGTTIVNSGTTTTNICNVPRNNLVGGTPPANMLYVNGQITSLKGTTAGSPAIQDGTALTITAENSITATGDVTYKTEPVTTVANQIVAGTTPACCAGSPVATLIPGHDSGQVLGIFTLHGDFNLKVATNNANIQVDGSIATISSGGTGGFKVTGSNCVNTFNNVGGQIQNSIYGACMSTQNVYFDRRFTSNSGFAPPWFPSTTLTTGITQPTAVISTVQRVRWTNQTTLQ